MMNIVTDNDDEEDSLVITGHSRQHPSMKTLRSMKARDCTEFGVLSLVFVFSHSQVLRVVSRGLKFFMDGFLLMQGHA
jgi:hypothetical protein